MEIAGRRGELIEKAVVERQAGFLLVAMRQRCMSAPSAWTRRLLNVSDARVMTERLKDMMASVLEDLSNLPEKVTDPDWVTEDESGNVALLTEDDGGNGDGDRVKKLLANHPETGFERSRDATTVGTKSDQR